MDAPSDRAPDPLAAWLAATQGGTAAVLPAEDTEPSARRSPRRRPRLVVAAVVPWLVVLVVAAAALSRSVPAAPASTPAGASVTTPAAAPAVAATTTALDPRLAAAAVLTVRLTAPDDQYIDTAVAERADALTGAVVVIVAAAVLDRVDGAWTGPRHVRFAVALSVGQAEPVALGAPWVLPTTHRAGAAPEGTVVEDASLHDAAAATLQAAGYRDVADPQLRRYTPLPDIVAVHVRARAPGELSARDHEIWLDAAASHVLGAPAISAPAAVPAPVPAEAS